MIIAIFLLSILLILLVDLSRIVITIMMQAISVSIHHLGGGCLSEPIRRPVPRPLGAHCARPEDVRGDALPDLHPRRRGAIIAAAQAPQGLRVGQLEALGELVGPAGGLQVVDHLLALLGAR